MKSAVRASVLSLAAVFVVAVGLPLFSVAAPAGASATNSCTVDFSGYEPTAGDAASSALQGSVTISVSCSGLTPPNLNSALEFVITAGSWQFAVDLGSSNFGAGGFAVSWTTADFTGNTDLSVGSYNVYNSFYSHYFSPLSLAAVYGPAVCSSCSGGDPASMWYDGVTGATSPGPAIVLGKAWGVVPPCQLTSVTGPSSFTNSALTYDFVTSGQDSVALIPSPTLTFTSAPSNWYAPYNLPGNNSPGSVDTFLESPMGDSFAFTMDLTNSDVSVLTGPAIAQVFAFQAWCFDGTSWFDWGDLATLVGSSGSGSGGSLSGCLGSVSIGVDPSSWVPALWSLGSCVLQTLLVPSQSAVNGLTSQFNGSGGSASNWMGSVVALFAVGPTKEFQTMQSDFAAPAQNSLLDTSVRFQGEPASVPSVNVQNSLAALTSSPQVHPFVGLILDLLTAGLLVLFFYLGVKFFINVFKG